MYECNIKGKLKMKTFHNVDSYQIETAINVHTGLCAVNQQGKPNTKQPMSPHQMSGARSPYAKKLFHTL